MSSFPGQSAVIVQQGSFLVSRRLDRSSQIEASVGDLVTPDTVIARTETMEKSFTLYLANELGVPNDSLKKYLTKSIGSAVTAGEPIARVRRGLRTASVKSPATGTLVHVDDTDGTVTLTASTGPRETFALVHGVIEHIDEGTAVRIQAEGSRVYGIVGFGGEATGTLVVGCDRHDRELTADQVSGDWKGAVVLAGMTVGVPALKKMRDAGVAAVIVGSISEGDIRRFVNPETEVGVGPFWTGHNGFPDAAASGLVIVATEGFGRLPMADPVYEFLAGQAGSEVSVTAHTATGRHLARPEIHIAGNSGEAGSPDAALSPERAVRVVDTHRLGMIGTIVSDIEERNISNGLVNTGVQVQFEDGTQEFVPVDNVEVLV